MMLCERGGISISVFMYVMFLTLLAEQCYHPVNHEAGCEIRKNNANCHNI